MTHTKQNNKEALANTYVYKSTDCSGEAHPMKLGHSPVDYYSVKSFGMCSKAFSTTDCTGDVSVQSQWMGGSKLIEGACVQVHFPSHSPRIAKR